MVMMLFGGCTQTEHSLTALQAVLQCPRLPRVAVASHKSQFTVHCYSTPACRWTDRQTDRQRHKDHSSKFKTKDVK